MRINNKEKKRRAGAALLAIMLSLTSIPAGAASPDGSVAGDTASTAVAAETEEELSGYGMSDNDTEFSTYDSTESAADSVTETPDLIEDASEEEQSDDTAADDFVPDTDYEGNAESVTALLPNELWRSNAEENEQKINAGEETDPLLEVYLSGKDDFPEDGYLRFSVTKDEELAGVLEEAEAFYQDYEIESLLPLKIGVLKKDGALSEALDEEYTELGPMTVRIYMEDTDFLDQNYLLHKSVDEADEADEVDEEVKWEMLNYVLYEGTENSLPYVEFETERLSDFLFVSLSEKNAEEETEEDHSGQEQNEASVEDETEDQEQNEASAESETENAVSKFDQRYPCSEDVESMDFSSCRIFIATDDPSVLEGVENYSEYNGLYLLTFSTEEEAKNAYTYFFSICDFVEVDEAVVSIAAEDTEAADNTKNTESTKAEGEAETESNTKSADSTETANNTENTENTKAESEAETENNTKSTESTETTDSTDTENEEVATTDAIAVLNELTDTENSKKSEDSETYSESKKIAVVDTGASEQTNVIKRVSVIGDTADDDNGHGDNMISYILSQDPDAEILSIKALDADGVGHVSDLYAAIEYAVSESVDIINLSVSAHISEGSEVISSAVKDAVDAGIIVVGAAGNNNKNAKYYIPGGIEDVIVTGACDESGQKIEKSNYGETVDYNVTANSTSEASAKLTGYISKNGIDGIKNILNKNLIFETKYVNSGENGLNEKTDGLLRAAIADSEFWTYGGNGSKKDAKISSVKLGSAANDFCAYSYSSYGYYNNNQSAAGTTVMYRTFDNNNSYLAWAYCCSPQQNGYGMGGKSTDKVYEITTPMLKKAIYYGPDYANLIEDWLGFSCDSTDDDDYQKSSIIVHTAVSEILARSGHAQNGKAEPGDGLAGASTALNNAVSNYVNHLKSADVPINFHVYVAEFGEGLQDFMFIKHEPIIRVTLHKGSTDPEWVVEPDKKNLYSVKGTEYWIYTTYDSAKKREDEKDYVGKFYGCDSDGWSCYSENNFCWLNLPPGTYYMIESKRDGQHGKNYKLSDEVITLVLNTNMETASQCIYVYNDPVKPSLQIKKSSSDTSITQGNSCYSLAGAKYRIYRTLEDAQNQTNPMTHVVHSDAKTTSDVDIKNSATYVYSFDPAMASESIIEFVTDSNGNSNIVEFEETGTFWIREYEAPPGYKLSEDIKDVNLTIKEETTVVSFTDEPLTDPLGLVINKKPGGDGTYTKSLEGVQFKIRYYDNLFETATSSNIESTLAYYSPERTWYFKTKKESGQYVLRLENEFLDTRMPNSALYMKNGEIVIPLGVITIEETRTADGYLKDGKFGEYERLIGRVYLQQDGSVETMILQGTASDFPNLEVENTPDLPPYPVVISKQDINGNEIGGAQLTITGREAYTGTAIVPISWTSVAGQNKTVSLKPGTYLLHETAVPNPEIYILASDITFTVDLDRNIKIADESVDKVTMVDEYSFAPIKIKKTVSGNMGDKYKQFTFNVNLRRRDGSVYTTDIKYNKGSDTGTLRPDSSGTIHFTLAHNEEIELENVWVGSTYTVTEDDYRSFGYTTTLPQNSSGTISFDNSDVIVANARNVNVPTGINTKIGEGFVGVFLFAIVIFAAGYIKKRRV